MGRAVVRERVVEDVKRPLASFYWHLEELLSVLIENSDEDRVGGSLPQQRDLDPVGRSKVKLLERSLQSSLAIDETSQRDPEPSPAAWGRSALRRLVKIAVGLSLVVSLGWGPLRAMLTTTSVEALVKISR